ncbi:Arc family DNA-binding protein [Pseudomonas mosselii]|uniref:Arc family DNA-binding protein n=1 Tax=Pseudomonas mosselii TaxID=78327 RepID=UPI0021D975B1|nr:Arc family DNA-binding protein [Pseudomonas mosselii]MCU9527495.1 Arc family DNA-binding protein [Pseudomonas mosselii]MCU9534808.1 Arc family DNA-binding protein [Pseudomonas mosselii]MCU9542742.1 Arc family DNA-binding protein [Pseudomonas mosselii]MCU9546648.1 Arc family DNA-binding protein [Pseudomonas mosselii]
MFAPKNSLAQKALNNARAQRQPRPKYNSKTADKYVIRTSRSLIDAVSDLGKVHGRSGNSEMVAAIMESLAGRQHTVAMRNILIARLGQPLSGQVLANVERRAAEPVVQTRDADKVVLRLPEGVRMSIIEVVARSKKETGRFPSMLAYVNAAIVFWINIQRECDALLSACMTMDESLTQLSGLDGLDLEVLAETSNAALGDPGEALTHSEC